MLRLLALPISVTLLALASSAVATCNLSAPRAHDVDAAGIDTVRIEAGAGALNVIGVAGSDSIDIDGRACASNESLLEQMRIDVEREGNTLLITAVTPQAMFLQSASLDLDVRLPERMQVLVDDRSGAISVSGVSGLGLSDASGGVAVRGILGDVRVDGDRSGELLITDVRGDVTIVEDASGDIEIREVGRSVDINSDRSGDIVVQGVTDDVRIEDDGSGRIEVSDVGGDVSIGEDGSGAIQITRVGGNVVVGDGGSGGITVETVGGNFRVGDAGSGSVRYSAVEGVVTIPND